MAQSDPTSDPGETTADDATDEAAGQVSENESLGADATRYGDAPADGATDQEDYGDDDAAADPRSAATTGRRSTDVDESRGDQGKKRTGKDGGGKASRSGNPARKAGAADERSPRASRVSRTPAKPTRVGNRWAAPAMVVSAGIGLLWIVVFYVSQDQIDIPFYSDLGSWNLVIGMGFIVAAFGFAMKWE